MTAQPHAQVRFRRAIERRALWLAEDAARELPNLSFQAHSSSSTSTPTVDRRSTRRRRCAGSSSTEGSPRLRHSVRSPGNWREASTEFQLPLRREPINPQSNERTVMGIIAFIILGLLAGLIAKAIMPGNDPGGYIVTTIIGVVGALLGDFLAAAILDVHPLDEFFDISTWLTAIVGSIIAARALPRSSSIAAAGTAMSEPEQRHEKHNRMSRSPSSAGSARKGDRNGSTGRHGTDQRY